jgi:predicted nucleic acid-binding protein
MPFSHSEYPIPREEYLRRIGEILEDKKTVVFLDTNILAYLFKLLGAARAEFFAWTEKLIAEDRLKVPAWALSEYLAKLTSGRIDEYTARSKEPDEIRKKLENLQNIASLFVDETVLSRIHFPGDRTEFLDQFEAATKRLSDFTKVFAHQFDAATIHNEIATKLSSAVLASNIAELTIRACTEGEMRAAQRMPPGYKDGGKGENKYGDLIIWFEILQYAKVNAKKFNKVVFLSNDEKPDWIYSPKNRVEIIKGVAKAVLNKDPAIRLADPRLVAEFHAVVGHRDFHIISLPVFIEGLSKAHSAGLENLASAIQVEVAKSVGERPAEGFEATAAVVPLVGNVHGTEQDEHLAGNEENDVAGVLPPGGILLAGDALASAVATAQLTVTPVEVHSVEQTENIYSREALRDSEYEIDETSALDVVIRELSSHNWYKQNPAVTLLRTLRKSEFSKAAWFVLGRNIYQAACGNAQKALEFVRDIDVQLSKFSDDVANHILAGALFEVYFDGDGQYRVTPKSGQIDPIFKMALIQRHNLAYDFICERLKPFSSRLVVLPGQGGKIELKVQLVQAMVPSASAVGWTFSTVKFAGHELLAALPQEGDADYFSLAVLHQRRHSLKSIASALSENWVVPSWQIQILSEPEFPIDTLFFVPDDKVLRVENFLDGSL